MNLPYTLYKIKQKLFLKNFDLMYRQGRVNPPLFAFWDSTKRCNLECIHCGSLGRCDNELDTAEIKGTIKELAFMGVEYFQITGGEPLMRHDFIEVLAYAKDTGLTTSFATNGYFLDEETAESISNTNVSLVQVSIDGARTIHNTIRGNAESFDRAVHAVRLLKKYPHINIGVATTVMPQNINALAPLKEMLLSLGIDLWNIGVVMPVGKAKNNPSLFLTKTQFNQLMEFMLQAKKEINVELGENFPYLGGLDNMLRKKPKLCPAGLLSCCIGSDGHVRGCPDQPDTDYYREGCTRANSFRDIWNRGFKRYRSRQILEQDKRCAVCKNQSDCFGGCWVMRENNSQCILNHLYRTTYFLPKPIL